MGLNSKRDLQRIADVINRTDADIVALQEVDRITARSDKINQPEVLAKSTGMEYAFGSAFDFRGGQFGNAILSRYEILSSNNIALPGNEPRSMIEVSIQMPESREVTFASVHLDLTEDARMQSLPIIKERMLANKNRPMILAGDFNTTPETKEIKALREDWQLASTESNTFTFPADIPNRQIDYIFYHSFGDMVVKSLKVINEQVASDHRPMLCVMDL